jgi:hypothetical protein
MDPIAVISLVVSGLSLIASVASAAIAVLAVRTSKRIAMETTTLQLHNFADQICHEHPELYELHGITAADLAREGVSPQELSYVVHSFDAGSAYYRIHSPTKVELTEYRRQMLQHPKVRKIWKAFIVGKTMSRSQFTEAVDQQIAALERQAPRSGWLNRPSIKRLGSSSSGGSPD